MLECATFVRDSYAAEYVLQFSRPERIQFAVNVQEQGSRHALSAVFNLFFFIVAPVSPMDELATAERNFAADAISLGVNRAFAQHLAAAAWIFRPYPVQAQDWLRKQPDNATRLKWGPQYIELSSAGDFAMSMGPWHIDGERDGKAVHVYGHFLSVWQRNAQGRWEVLVDHGASHAEATQNVVIEPRNAPAIARPVLSTQAHAQRLHLLEKTDDGLSHALRHGNPAATYKRYATADVLMLRDGEVPAPGAMPDVLKDAKPGLGTAPRRAAGISRSGDLGYTLGGSDTPENAGRGMYERVWRYNGKVWQLSADVTDSAE